MGDYTPVPVHAARQIAEAFHKDAVVIVSLDRACEMTHTTTYGRSAEDKDFAAAWGDRMVRAVGVDPRREGVKFYEDFRDPTKAATAAANCERLRWLISALLAYDDELAPASPRRLPFELQQLMRAEMEVAP